MRRFLLISVFLHAAVAVLLQHADTNRDDALLPGQIIELTLQTFSEPARSTPAAATPAQEPASRPDPTPAPASRRHEPPAPERHITGLDNNTRSAAETDTRPTEPPADNRETLSTLRAAVYSALQARFTYPRRARKRGWEGTVVIALRIMPDGQLADIHVADSSGVAVLDRAALRSLAEVSIPRHVAWLDGREIDMLIPVEYRLTDS